MNESKWVYAYGRGGERPYPPELFELGDGVLLRFGHCDYMPPRETYGGVVQHDTKIAASRCVVVARGEVNNLFVAATNVSADNESYGGVSTDQ